MLQNHQLQRVKEIEEQKKNTKETKEKYIGICQDKEARPKNEENGTNLGINIEILIHYGKVKTKKNQGLE